MRDLLPWLSLILRRPGRLAGGTALLALALASGIGLLALSGWFITSTAITGALLAAGARASMDLYTPGGGIRLFALTRTVSRYLERVYNHDAVLRLLTTIRCQLFSSLASHKAADRGRLRGAQWLARLTSDVDTLDTVYLRLIAPAALALLLTLVLLVVVLAGASAKAALFTGVLLGGALLTSTILLAVRAYSVTMKRVDDLEQVRTAVVEHIEGFGELTAAGRAGKHGARLCRMAGSVARCQAMVDRQSGWHGAVSATLVNVGVLSMLWSGLLLFQSQQLSGPLTVLFPLAILGLGEIYASLPDGFVRFGAVVAAARRLNSDCIAPDAIAGLRDASSVTEPDNPDVALKVSNLRMRYGCNPPLLVDCAFELHHGERLAIIGASGSGKSSLADIIAGVQTAQRGTVSAIAAAYLTQATVLFDDTLRQNLLIAHPLSSEQALWQVLEAVDLAERFSALPGKLDTWLGPHGHHLSGGEARRVALARVLLSPARLLLLDEPFTGVDEATRKQICQAIEPWLADRTVVGFGHSATVLPPSDRTVRL